jgi:hypothetical protein
MKYSQSHQSHTQKQKTHSSNGVSKNIEDCRAICPKLPKLCTRIDKNLKKCTTLDGVSKDIEDYCANK